MLCVVTKFIFLFNRSVWERVEPQATTSLKESFTNESSLVEVKETYGSQETLYHSCWSLADCGNRDKLTSEDTEPDSKSLNESLLTSNSGPGLLELGLKWPSGLSGDPGGNIWGRIPSEGNLDKVCDRKQSFHEFSQFYDYKIKSFIPGVLDVDNIYRVQRVAEGLCAAIIGLIKETLI